MQNSQERPRSIPSLDGLRAFSVLAVILGHTRSSLLDRIPFQACFRDGAKGVAVFFVISGFLITHLILKEMDREGTLNLKRFYVRRTFRIFPPFYVFLLIVAGLGLFRFIEVSPRALLVAATYTWNYVPLPETWVLGHCWSLTLEEQFYLLWPLSMALFSRRTNLRIASAVILLSPVSRIVTYYAWPSMRYHVDMMLHTHLDTIMTGCLLALLLNMKIGERVTRLALSSFTPFVSLFFLVFLDTYAKQRFHGMYLMTVGFSLENLAIAALMLYVIFRHQSPLGKLLNVPFLMHLGTISYSLYLYQQLFTGPFTRHFPLNLLFIVVAAELSYFLVEKPSFRLRDLVQRRFSRAWTPATPSQPLAQPSP